jgi:selenide, water dikinase
MKRLLLLGGGHAHAFVLRGLAGAPLADTRVTLVTPHDRHTYSGMIPGLMAGHYTVDEVQFDVAALARVAGAEVVSGSAAGLDLALGVAELEDGRRIAYDFVSLNLGSAPNTSQVPGADAYALPAKPFERFLEGWYAMLAQDASHVATIALVGAGAAGVELAMSIRHRYVVLGREVRVVLYSEKPSFAAPLMQRITRALQRNGVEIRADAVVEAVERGESGAVLVVRGQREACDAVIWTAGAAPYPWFAASGLATDEQGFVLVDETLRSTSHPTVFAVGDCATLRDARHAKSGVFAVRHGNALARNLRRAVEGRSLARFSPQKRALALISCGARYAIADWGGLAAEGEWVWRWKDWLDRRWVKSFQSAADPGPEEPT